MQYKLIHGIYTNLDDKLNDMLKTNFTILTIIIGVGYFLMEEIFSLVSMIFLIVSIILLAIGAILGIINHIPQEIEFLNPFIFYDRHYDDTLEDLLELAAVTIGDTINNLKIISKRKAILLKNMQYLMILGITSLAISFLALILNIP